MKPTVIKTLALSTSCLALMMLTAPANAQMGGAMSMPADAQSGAPPLTYADAGTPASPDAAASAMPTAAPAPASNAMAGSATNGSASDFMSSPTTASAPAPLPPRLPAAGDNNIPPSMSGTTNPGLPSKTAVAASGASEVSSVVGPHSEDVAPTGTDVGTGHTMDQADVKSTGHNTPAHSQDSKVMNLRDVVAVGLLDNPEYGIVANNRRATDEELNQAVDLYYPSLDYRGDGGYEHTNNPTTRSLYTDGRSGNMWQYDTGLTLTQLLFDGWETAYENQRQKYRVLSASHRVREAAELTGLSIVESYLEVMRQRELLKAARDNVAQHMDIQNQITDSSAAGRTTQADVEQARARVSSARAEEASVREALRSAEAAFIQQAGDAPRDLVMPVVPVDQLAADVEEEVKQTQYQSPTIEIKQADIDVAHSEMDKAKAPMYPKVDLQLNGRTGTNLDGEKGQDTSATAEVVVNWNLYRGGGDVARVREAIDRWSQAKSDRLKSQRDVDNDVRQTWARMVSAGERARQYASQADANVEVVKAYHDQFNLNRRTLLDVLDSQNEEYVSRSNMINAEYIEIFAVYRLLALKGELMKTLNIALPAEAVSDIKNNIEKKS